jgi:hypothetical protein
MRRIHEFVARLIYFLKSYTFNSDYQVEAAIIQNVYSSHSERINSDSPSRYLWRSVCQYQCQGTARQKRISLAANIIAFLGLPLLLFLVRPKRKADTPKVPCKYLKIDFHMAYQVPAIIKEETLEKSVSGKYLTLRDLTSAFGLFIRNRAFYPELLFEFVCWIASVRPSIDLYNPKYLIQYCEYSAYSSLRKLYLNRQRILVANVAHGEVFLSCRSAFSSFDQYFAWETTPRAVLDGMHIEYTDFISFNPCTDCGPAPTVAIPTLGFLWPSIDFSDHDVLVAQLNRISNYCTVLVRPHPSPKHRNHFETYRHLMRAQVSDASNEDIHCFIDRCSLMAGHFSSALIQAALRGREVLYLHDAYLASLREYFEYYQKVNAVDLEDLDTFVSAKLGLTANRL